MFFFKKALLILFIIGGTVFGSAPGPVAYDMAGSMENTVVVSVEYSLAPQHPYPEGLKDCYEAFEWVQRNADGVLGGDKKRIGIIGESGGGLLTTALALMIKDKNELYRPILVVPIVPMLSPLFSSSLVENYDFHAVEAKLIMWCWSMYSSDLFACAQDKFCSPLAASDWTGKCEWCLFLHTKAPTLTNDE